MNYNRVNLFLLLLLVTITCLGQEIGVSDYLSERSGQSLPGLFEKLEGEPWHSVVICNAFTTRFDVLEKAAKMGAHIDVIAKKKHISKDYSKVEDKKAIVGYQAKLHDKIALIRGSKGWSANIGSANFSTNHLKNTELVLYIPDATKMPGLMEHVTKLFEKATLSEAVRDTPRPTSLPLGQKVFPDKRRGSLTSEGVVSCFDFADDSKENLVSYMANRIKVNEARTYHISSMNLDHPVFIDRIKKAVRNGSAFSIIVNQDEKHLTEGHALLGLSQFAKGRPNQIVLVWKNGGNAESNIHHAKLFVRSPNSRGENGLTIVPTANFTKKGGSEFNCAVMLPHDSANSDTIKALREKFNAWWKHVKQVPNVSISRAISVESDSSKIADYVINGIMSNRSCAYYLATGALGNKRCVDSIRNSLSSKNGSVFKIILLKKWIEKDTGIYKDLKQLAINYPRSIEIKSWDKGRKKKEIGGKRILTKGFTVFLRRSLRDTVLPYSVITPSHLAHAKKSDKDIISRDPSIVKKAICDFKAIEKAAVAVI